MHEAHGELAGTTLGHVVPGALLALWGVWWFLCVARALREATHGVGTAAASARSWPLRTVFGAGESWIKILIPLAGAVGELWWASWRLTDTSVINYQHATMYLGFTLAGVTDVLVRRGHIPAYGAHLALAAAFATAGFQFLMHGDVLAVSHAVHALIGWLFLLQAAATLVELAFRHPALSLARAYVLGLLGAWFLQVAWILYHSGWELGSAASVMRVQLFFTWHVFGIAIALGALYPLLARLAMAAQQARAGAPTRAAVTP